METNKLVQRVAQQLRDASRNLVHIEQNKTFQYIVEACRKELPIDFVAMAMANGTRYELKAWSGVHHSVRHIFPLQVDACTLLLTEEVVTNMHVITKCALCQTLYKSDIPTWFTVPFKIDDTHFGFCLIGYLKPIALIPDMGPVFNEFGKDVGVSMLYHHEKNDKQQLEQLLTYQQTLLNETLNTDELDGITLKLSELLNNSIVVLDRFEQPICKVWRDIDEKSKTFGATYPVHVGQDIFGYIALLHQPPKTHYVQLSIEVAKNIYAIQFMKQKIAFDAYEKQKEQLLHNLMQTPIDTELVYKQAALLNVPLNEPHYIAIIDTTVALDTLPTPYDDDLLIIYDQDIYIVLMHASVSYEAFYSYIAKKADVQMLVSYQMTDITTYHTMIALLKNTRKLLPNGLHHYESLGVYPLLQQIDTYDLFMKHYIEPLNDVLIDTLQSYFAHHMNASETAQALYIHRSTLLYRLSKVESLLHLSLQDAESTFALQLALKLHQLHNLS